MDSDNTHNELTEEQTNILLEFREKVQDILTKPEHDDLYLLRWLRARSFNLKEAEEMLHKNVAWRKKWKADSILRDWTPPEVLKKYFPSGLCGYDKEGCPVWIFPAKGLHMKSITMSVKKSDVVRYMIYLFEAIHEDFKKQSQKLGRRIDKVVLLEDLEGFTLKQLFMPGMDIMFKFMAMTEANYPETMKYAFVFNGPFIFPIVFRLVKPLLSADTKQKIVVLGKNWKQELLKHIDPDQLPVHWGGTATDPDGDPYCRSKVCLGGEVPPEYYIKGTDLVDESKVTKKVLGKGETLNLTYKVTSGDQALRWVFWTESHDIGFGISYQPADGKPEQIIADTRINCQQVPEDGIHKCVKPGTYIVKFDNSYSWMNSKHLSYSIELVDMSEIDSDTVSLISGCSATLEPESLAETSGLSS